MTVMIENLTDKPLWLTLNSGATLSVMPRSRREVPEGEVLGNAKLRKLHDRALIRTQPPYGDAKEAADEKAPPGRDAAKKKSVKENTGDRSHP